MKKIFALALLLGVGIMIGCGEEKKPTTGSGAKPTTAAPMSTTAAPKDTK